LKAKRNLDMEIYEEYKRIKKDYKSGLKIFEIGKTNFEYSIYP
jgi:ATP-dependent protease Clp ATPase subunit